MSFLGSPDPIVTPLPKQTTVPRNLGPMKGSMVGTPSFPYYPGTELHRVRFKQLFQFHELYMKFTFKT